MLNNSAGVFGTRRIIIFRPSVEPIPIDANDRIDVASENNLPLQSDPPKTNELVRGNESNVCNGCGDVYDVVKWVAVVGVKKPSFVSTWLPVRKESKIIQYFWIFCITYDKKWNKYNTISR